MEDQGAGQEPRSVDVIVVNPDNQPDPDQMSTKIIKYSEIKDIVDSEHLNSDIVIEMHPVSATNFDTQISSSGSGSDNKARVSEISLDMQPNEVLATINMTVNPMNQTENSDQVGPSRLSANRSDE